MIISRHALRRLIADRQLDNVVRFVRREAQKLPDANDRKRFAELAETELTSLHDGNFARYRLRPAEFAAWQKKWR